MRSLYWQLEVDGRSFRIERESFVQRSRDVEVDLERDGTVLFQGSKDYLNKAEKNSKKVIPHANEHQTEEEE